MLDLSYLHNTENGERATGSEIELQIPLFDWGGAQRAAMNAQTLAAANQYESVLRAAAPQLRTSYSAYRTRYDLARHYRDEIVPLEKLPVPPRALAC